MSKLDVPEWLPTDEAARLLQVAVITLRRWSLRDDAPLRPVKIAGKLRWPVDGIKRLLAEGERR